MHGACPVWTVCLFRQPDGISTMPQPTPATLRTQRQMTATCSHPRTARRLPQRRSPCMSWAWPTLRTARQEVHALSLDHQCGLPHLGPSPLDLKHAEA
jgi:hypothetical protein